MYFYHGLLATRKVCYVNCELPFLACPSDTQAGDAEQDVHEWEDKCFYGGETGPGLSFPDSLFQGRYHFSPSHLFKNSPHFSPAKAKQTGQGKGFYF